ncbi:acyltransferase [Pelagicoccus mobilis]|uniref:Acyltransferase n=1 Tax=Pelagicoccus mobilis TaxID=415221 RepID=A0A934VQC7_9BACT|nr:acyltransferase [Pelagicoccus mobilis]
MPPTAASLSGINTYPRKSHISNPSKSRFASLDSLRAIACFLVIWHHVSESLLQIASGGAWMKEVAEHYDFGRIGVVAFFCISGFVIPNSLRGERFPALRRFAINRFFRLYPIYWLSILIGLLAIWQGSGKEWPATTLLANFLMGATFMNEPHVMGLYWTLEIELVFYVFVAALYLAFTRHRLLACLLGFALSYTLWQSKLLWEYQGNLPILGDLLSIMFTTATLRCVCELDTDPFFGKTNYHKLAAKALLGVMVYLTLSPFLSGIQKGFLTGEAPWFGYGWGHALGIGLFALFFLLKPTPSWLASAGRTTYSAYLFHAIVFDLVAKLWTNAELPQVRLELLLALCTTLTFALAHLCYRYIEKPSIHLGRRLAKKF